MKTKDWNILAMAGLLKTVITVSHSFATSLEQTGIAEQKDDILGNRHEQEFRDLSKIEFMVGDRKGAFRSHRSEKSGKFAALLAHALESPAPQSHFSSLEVAHLSLRNEINRATTAGIINERGNKIFATQDTITREVVLTTIDRALQRKSEIDLLGQLPFTDQDAAYNKFTLQQVCKMGILNENGQNHFAPKAKANSADSVTLLNRMLHVINKEKPINRSTEFTATSYLELDLRLPSKVTSKDIDDYIVKYHPNSPLVGHGKYYIEAEGKYGVNAHAMVARDILEASYERFEIAYGKHNFTGIRAYDKNPFYYTKYLSSYKSSIFYVAKFIRENYLEENGKYYNGTTLICVNDTTSTSKIASIMQCIKPFNAKDYKDSKILNKNPEALYVDALSNG